jgi:hypothetical protein
MKKFLALCEHGSFMKILFTNDSNSKDLISEVQNAITECPYDTFETPTGTCKVYKENNTWIAVTDDMCVEILENETDVEVHLDFEDEINVLNDFKDMVYLKICYILGHIIYRDPKLYRDLLIPYMSSVIGGVEGSPIDFNEYKRFTDLEEKVNNITDHISMQDIIFHNNMRNYVDSDEIIAVTVIDMTFATNVFKIKDIFFIGEELYEYKKKADKGLVTE